MRAGFAAALLLGSVNEDLFEQSFRAESQGGDPACRRTQSVMGPYWEIVRTALGVSRGPRECLIISTRGFVIVWRTFFERLTDRHYSVASVIPLPAHRR